ncbi:MAG: hypothetical protein ACI89J_004152 [Hyphomicrobiaceae bacterium]|jgi:uncharacterized protein YijF (DUF1287 family)
MHTYLAGARCLAGLFAVVFISGHTPASAQQAAATTAARPAFAARLIAAAEARINKTITYDPAYVSLKYPGGDVAPDRGVCSDVVIRAYRALGIDLQQRIHEDMRRKFRAYPARWGLKRPDPNIDHRRVPNLRRFFTRQGQSLPVSIDASAYQPGDLVTWDVAKPRLLPGTLKFSRPTASGRLAFARTPHIGIVTDKLSPDGKRPLIVHNIGGGTVLEDMLFAYQITGRYRFGE